MIEFIVNAPGNFLGRLLSAGFISNPIFIVGTGRSGTSALLQALGKHPSIISMPGEAPFLTSIGGEAALFEMEDSRRFYRESTKVSMNYFHATLRKLALEISGGRNYALNTLLRSILKDKKNPFGIKNWCVKTFPTKKVTTGLLALYPEAKFIYIIRNGIEVVNSMGKFHGFSEGTFEEHCKSWAHGVEKYNDLLSNASALLVRHEQYVSHPEQVLNDIYEFLALAKDDAGVEFSKKSMIHPLDKPSKTNTNVNEMLSNRAPAYMDWTEDQKSAFKKYCANEMSRMGYEIPF